MGKALDSPCVINFWIPDGYKDVPIDRYAPRQRLQESLDEIFEKEMDTRYLLDAGHFHPTEVISDKISSVMNFTDQILLNVSRGVRWDSDHVVTLTDELKAIAEEIVRGHFEDRVHIGLDFFDASINRVAAWVIGARNMLKALMMALLEPTDLLKQL